MIILAIDTSCDETSVAVTEGRKVLSHLEYTQVATHAQWGGVVPSLAKRAHEDRIEWAIEKVLSGKKGQTGWSMDDIDAIAVTVGPGLAIALEVGIRTACMYAKRYDKPIIPVNHMAGHIYSCFVQNTRGNPARPITFPYLALLVSGGHTELVRIDDHHTFSIIGETRDDAMGESLDKAARMLGFGYPGGPVIERMAERVDNVDTFRFPRPMIRSEDLDFSFAGLKTSFLYYTQKMDPAEKLEKVDLLASSYQEAAFDSAIRKLAKAIDMTGITSVLVAGGVAVNTRLRSLVRSTVRLRGGHVHFPPYKYLNFDNAAMIGVAAGHMEPVQYVSSQNLDTLDRIPRLRLA